MELQVPPHDSALEQSILGAMLMERDCIQSCMEIVTTEEMFYDAKNKYIFKRIKESYLADESVDVQTLSSNLKISDLERKKEYVIYISTLTTNGPASGANIEEYSTILKELFLRREIISLTQRAMKYAFDMGSDAFETYDQLLTKLEKLNTELSRTQQIGFYEIVTERIHELKTAGETKTYTTGIISGLKDLDYITTGFQNGDLIIIAARPSMGKTALAIDMARKQANKGIPVGIFSLEMSSKQLVDRMLSAETEIPMAEIKRGGLTYDKWQILDEATPRIKLLPIQLCSKGGLSINDICSTAKAWKIKYGIKIIYLDYIQLASGTDSKNGREQEVAQISRRLKGLAGDLDIPVVAISQLSRECEKRGDKRPNLSDLRESGSIEQDADVVMFPFREHYYNPNAEEILCEIMIAKNRNGPAGEQAKVSWHKEIQTFKKYDDFN